MSNIREVFNWMLEDEIVEICGVIDINLYTQSNRDLYTINNIGFFKTLKITSISKDGFVNLIDSFENLELFDIPCENIKIKHCLSGIEAKDFFYKYFNRTKTDSKYYDYLFEFDIERGVHSIQKGYFKMNNNFLVFDVNSYPITIKTCNTFDEARYILKIDFEAKFYDANIYDASTDSIIDRFNFAIPNEDIYELEKNIYNHNKNYFGNPIKLEDIFQDFIESYLENNYGVITDSFNEISENQYVFDKFLDLENLEKEHQQYYHYINVNNLLD